jgi:hypothetical protein
MNRAEIKLAALHLLNELAPTTKENQILILNETRWLLDHYFWEEARLLGEGKSSSSNVES